jgi:hypothetical protein
VVINGTYTQGASGTLALQIDDTTASDGASAANDYTHLDVHGTVNYDGTFGVTFANSFSAQAGESFQLLQVGGATSGQFSSLELPTLTNDLRWDTRNLYSTGELAVGSYDYYWTGDLGTLRRRGSHAAPIPTARARQRALFQTPDKGFSLRVTTLDLLVYSCRQELVSIDRFCSPWKTILGSRSQNKVCAVR